jgi:hypothetical protein
MTITTELREMRQSRKQSGQQEIVRLQANKIFFIAAAGLKKRDKMLYIDGIHVMVAGTCIRRCNIQCYQNKPIKQHQMCDALILQIQRPAQYNI